MKKHIRPLFHFFSQYKKKKKHIHQPKICLHKKESGIYLGRKKQLKIRISTGYATQFYNTYKQYIVLGFIPAIVGIALIVFLSPIFTIQYIQVYRDDNITNMSLAYTALEDFREKRIFLIDEEEIKTKLQDYQNNIKDISVAYKLPDTIEIRLSSYPEYFLTYHNKKPYTITQNGSMIPSKETNNYVEMGIFGKQNNVLPDYKQIYKQTDIEAIYEAIHYLEKNIPGVTVTQLSYYPTEKEIHFQLENDSKLIYTLARNLEEQIEKTVIYHMEHKPLTDNDIIYIDFRVQERIGQNKKEKIFGCYRENEYQCLQNLKKIYPNE